MRDTHEDVSVLPASPPFQTIEGAQTIALPRAKHRGKVSSTGSEIAVRGDGAQLSHVPSPGAASPRVWSLLTLPAAIFQQPRHCSPVSPGFDPQPTVWASRVAGSAVGPALSVTQQSPQWVALREDHPDPAPLRVNGGWCPTAQCTRRSRGFRNGDGTRLSSGVAQSSEPLTARCECRRLTGWL